MLKKALKRILSENIRRKLRVLHKLIVYTYRRYAIAWPVFRDRPLKIIAGAALTSQQGWYSTNEQWLDITSARDWDRVFRGRQLITHVVAEHVFEHLTEEEASRALNLIYQHMKSGGRLRIAVPDGYHPDKEYIRHVGVEGIGADAADHKQLLTMDRLTTFLEEAGFTARPQEGYRANGTLLQEKFDPDNGLIHRSRSNPENIAGKQGWDFVDANTSLIVDGVK